MKEGEHSSDFLSFSFFLFSFVRFFPIVVMNSVKSTKEQTEEWMLCELCIRLIEPQRQWPV